ncbi:RagB/SusD family nutrient uptake outer membrane protein [Echinicola sediminis]
MNKIAYISIIAIGISSLSLSSCVEEDITKLPVTALSEDEFWNSEEQVAQAANAAYLTLENVGQIEWDGFTEVIYSQTGSTKEISTGGINPGSSVVNSLWTSAYGTIRDANWFLNNVDKAPVEASLMAKYKGQMRFIRAWAHYRLMYQFGNVPIVEEVLDISEGKVAPNNRAEVLNFVINELDQTISELSNPGYSPEFGRITVWAAKALKSRILLYEGTLEGNNEMLNESAALAKDIMDNGGFSLHPNYTELFRPEGDGSNEVILSRINADMEGQYHSLGQMLGPVSFHASWNIFSPTVALVETYPDINGESIETSPLYNPQAPFENRDPRLKQTVFDWRETVNYEGAIFENTGTWFNFRKFIDPSETAEQRSHNDHIIFRLAEMYLGYAEAINEVQGPNQQILDLVNELRTRAGKGAADDGSDIIVPPIQLAGLTKEQFREIIRRERIIELVGEGILYYDYHRWKLLESTMNKPALAVVPLEDRVFTAPRDYTWPIPEFELINNDLLSQNPGY